MVLDADLGKAGFARKLFRIRWHGLGLSQRAFAAQFGLAYATVRDLEQGRAKPNYATEVLLEAIRLNPRLVARAARNAVVDPDCTRFADLHGVPVPGTSATTDNR